MSDVKISVEPLLKDLEDQDWECRFEACKLIGFLGDETCVEPLLLRSTTDPNDWVRKAARAAIIRIGRPAITPLAQAILQNGDWLVRYESCKLLRRLISADDAEAVSALTQASQSDDSELVRRAARKALDKLGIADKE